jgi:hypothetical protein
MEPELDFNPSEILKLPDSELGFWLLATFAKEQAKDLGMSLANIDEQFIESVRQYVLTLEADSAENAPLQVALHKVASGHPHAAGKIIREHLCGGARNMRLADEFLKKRQSQLKGAKKGAQTRAENSKKEEILRHAKRLKALGTDERDIAGVTARHCEVSASYVRRVLSPTRKKKRNEP